jgi:hypothetical protein
MAAVPYKIHTMLTDNGIQFTTPGAVGSAVPLIKEAIANHAAISNLTSGDNLRAIGLWGSARFVASRWRPT